VGPLPPSNGFTYLLTCVDRSTRWPEALPISNITAETVAQVFLQGQISRFGVPSTVTTDQGKQFESALWNHLMQLLGCKRIRTTSYRLIANGLVERFHCHLKSSMKAYVDTTQWATLLPMILLGIRTSLKTDLHCTTAELVYGTTLRLPGQFFNTSTDITTTDPSDYVSKLKAIMYRLKSIPPRQSLCKNSAVSSALSNCTHVFICHDAVKKPLQPPYNGPFQVISRTDKHFTVEVKGKKKLIV